MIQFIQKTSNSKFQKQRGKGHEMPTEMHYSWDSDISPSRVTFFFLITKKISSDNNTWNKLSSKT